jgi:hypothetical protein
VRAAPGNSRVAIELGSKAERLVDPRLTRRLIQLELGDVEVPPVVTGIAAAQPPALFYRVLATRPEEIRVELWERGEYHGARSVSLSSGTAQLHARRIALAAAELARRLRGKRIAEAKRLASPPSNGDNGDDGWSGGRPGAGIGAGVRAAGLGPSDLWLVGPELAGRLRLGESLRFELAGAWMHGQAAALSGSPITSWMEVSIAPGYAAGLAHRLNLIAQLRFAAAIVHLSDVLAVDGIEREEETWSARAAFELGLEAKLSRAFAVHVAPEAGVVLRRIPALGREGDFERIGGLWLGASLGASFDAPLTRATHVQPMAP